MKRKVFDFRVGIIAHQDMSDNTIQRILREHIAGWSAISGGYAFIVEDIQELQFRPETPELIRCPG